MLRRIHIRNVALIEEQAIEFDDGFSVLTGETGAGKSIIIESFNFVLGERASRELIKFGAQKASVEAMFSLTDSEPVTAVLQEMELCPEDGELVLYRELSQTGKNVCRVNGMLVSTAMLKQIGDALIDIHGQHAHQSLLNAKMHLSLLDSFAGTEVRQLQQSVAACYRTVTAARHALLDSQMNERERAQKCDLYAYQIKEIQEANLQDGEEESLLDERKKLRNAQTILEALGEGAECLGGDQGALTQLSAALRGMERIADCGAEYAALADRLRETYYALEDASYTLRDQRDTFTYDPRTLDEIEWRLETISRLKRKYGSSIAEILSYADSIAIEYQNLLNVEERREHLQAEYDAALLEYTALAERLSQLRKEAGDRLALELLPELSDLGMPNASFAVQMDRLSGEAPSASGLDAVEFMLSANRGEPIKPLSKVASGGEISRIMLAFKKVLAKADGIPTMVFDEIDTGVSGRIGTAVAEKMRQIAAKHQVLCVTHLAQIAAHAHVQYLIQKETVGERTVSSAQRLDDKARCAEIARIMGGDPEDPVALQHAAQLMTAANTSH